MSIPSLRRYTSLPFLLDILNKKSLTLLDPLSWDDKNDSYFLKLYKEKKGFKSVLALCFADSIETYHHWKIYSGSPSGICIEFAKENLSNCINVVPGIRTGYVEYQEIRELKERKPDISELPFIKRFAFQDEKEFRIIYENETDEVIFKEVSIKLDCISRIIINPWIHKSVFESVKSVIRKIEGCQKVRIDRSTLIESEKWKKLVEKV